MTINVRARYALYIHLEVVARWGRKIPQPLSGYHISVTETGQRQSFGPFAPPRRATIEQEAMTSNQFNIFSLVVALFDEATRSVQSAVVPKGISCYLNPFHV